MKLRRMMAIVAVLALVTWLVVPAVRIWRDPSLLKHSHTFDSEFGEGPFSLRLNQVSIEANHIVLTHDSSFGKVYRQILLNPRAAGSTACPDLPKIVRSTRPESKNFGPGSMATPDGLEPPPPDDSGHGRPSTQP